MTMPRISKSWSMTFIAFIIAVGLPMVNEHLEQFGIIITEEELQHFLYVLFGVGAIGGGSAAYKRHDARKKAEIMTMTTTTNGTSSSSSTITPNNTKPYSATMPLLPEDDMRLNTDDLTTSIVSPKPAGKKPYYRTNFIEDPEVGNSLPYGMSKLHITFADARSYVTGTLHDDKGNLLQVAQSVVGGDSITFNLKKHDGTPYEKGEYILVVQGDRGTGDSNRITDRFEIV